MILPMIQSTSTPTFRLREPARLLVPQALFYKAAYTSTKESLFCFQLNRNSQMLRRSTNMPSSNLFLLQRLKFPIVGPKQLAS